MVNKTHRSTQRDEQLSGLSLRSSSFGSRHAQINHDYADANILRLSAFFRDNPNPILVFSPDGNVLKANPAAQRLLRRLQIQETDLLPENHLQIVQACMNGEIRECGVEVKTRDRIFALTYHPIASFKLVYLYAIEMTEFRRAEEDLLRIASKTLALAKHAVQRLQAFRKTMPHPPQPHRQQNSSTEMFVAMDGCVFVSGDRLGEWDLD